MKYFYLIIILLFSSKITISQSISLGIDTNISFCQNCVQLKAKIVNPNAGTPTYTLDSVLYHHYPYQASHNALNNFTANSLACCWSPISLYTGSFSDTLNIPFNFCFFNKLFTKCAMNSNGYLTFHLQYINQVVGAVLLLDPLPNSNNLSNTFAISPPSNDLMGADTINHPATWDVYGTAPNRVFVVNWYNMCCNLVGTTCNNTMQIALHEGSNIIENNIEHKDNCVPWWGDSTLSFQGIQDTSGTQVVMVPGRNPFNFGIDHESWVYTPNDHTTEWYDVNNNLLATGVDSLQVCPTTAVSTYYVKSLLAQCGGGSVWVSDTITITKLGAMAINNVVTTNPACYGYTNGHIQFSVLNAVAPLSYTINNNATPTNNIQNLSAGTYTIQATDAQGCTASSIITLTDPNPIELQIISQTDIVCKGDKNATLTLAATGGISPYQYSSSQTTWSTNPLLQNLSAGIILCTVKDANNCQDTMSTTLIEPQTALSISTQITNRNDCKQDKVGHVETNVQGGNAPYTYLWNTIPPTYYNVLQFAENGTYQVTVTDATGCAQTATVSLTPTLHCELQIPNAFTPNGDNLNETFRIKDYCGGIISYQIKIFNRWGNMVYSSRDFTQGLDGKYNGTMQSNDVFTYYIEYNCQENKETKTYLQKGEVILLR